MSLSRRLNALERLAGSVGPCRTCGGCGLSAVVVVESPADPVQPEGCSECGKVADVKWIILDDPKSGDGVVKTAGGGLGG